MHHPTDVLVFVPQEDHVAVAHILNRDFKPLFAASLAEVLSILEQRAVPVLLCEKNTAGVDWKEVLEAVRAFPRPPHVVVVSKHADNHLFVEVGNLGGYNVIRTPYYESVKEMIRIVRLGAHEWLTAA
jgi:DNA-binding NtrC family response regulator